MVHVRRQEARVISAIRRRKGEDRPSPNELISPEGVALTLPVAGVGVRISAQIIDMVITMIGAVCLLIVAGYLGQTAPNTWKAIATLLFFAIRVPYYVFAELLWNGQTLGKRLMKIKVISHDGGPLSANALVLRNLMKEAEVFLPATLVLALAPSDPLATLAALAWILIGLSIPFFDRYRRRLGDMMAGTHVIHLPVPVLLKDLAGEPQRQRGKSDDFEFLSHQLDHYGAFELQTLESLLRGQDTARGGMPTREREETIRVIVEKIRNKIGYADPVAPGNRLRFLRAFYKAQRAYLEQRQLFGDRRSDKHHDKNGQEGPPVS
jgi:uncharacterized RDD family membrane protein YckC